MGLLLSRLTPSSYSVTFSYSVTDESLIGLDIQDLTVIGADIDSVSISSNINWTTQSSSHSSSLINFSSVYFNGVSIGDTVEVTFDIDLLVSVKTVFFYFGNTRINDAVTLDQALTGSIAESLPSGSDVFDTSVLNFSPTQLSGTHSSIFSLDSQDSQLSIDTSIASEAISEFAFVATDSNNNVLNLNILNIDGNDAPTSAEVTLESITEDSGGYTITASALLANAADVEGDTLSVSALAISSGLGTLDDNGDGSWVYTPATDDDSDVSFSYTITDDGLTDGVADNLSIAGTAVLDITPVNDAANGMLLIEGSVIEDQTLTAITNSISDTDGLGSFNYQWYAGNVAIIDATLSTFVLTQSHVGDTIRVEVNYTDASGFDESLASAATLAVTNVNDLPSGEIIILGEAQADETLAVDVSNLTDEDGIGELSYQWYVDGVAAADDNDSTFILTVDEIGSVINVDVSYVDLQGANESISSPPTGHVIERTATDLSISFINRSGDAMSGVSGLMHEVAADRQIFIRPTQLGDSSDFELVVRPTTTINALDFFVEDSNSLSEVVLTAAVSNWTHATDISTANVFGFSGFGAIDDSQAIMAGQETVVARFTSSGDSHKAVEMSLTDVVLGGQVLADRTITFDSALVDNSSITFTPEDNSIVWLDGLLSYSRTSRAINAQDALEAFRLALNQSTTSGSKSAADYVSADFDRNGSVSTNDALEILNYALRRPNFDAEWVFIDTEADLDGIGRRSSSYDTGKLLMGMDSAESAVLIGILLGDVNDSFNY